MKIDNYLSRWQEFHDWSVTNRPEILESVESLGQKLRDSINEYREASDPDERQLQLDAIKQHYDRVVQWHMKEILSKLSGES
jgi:hypothetical protein